MYSYISIDLIIDGDDLIIIEFNEIEEEER